MTKDEISSIVVRYADQFEADAKQGVEYLNTVEICFRNTMKLTVTPFH